MVLKYLSAYKFVWRQLGVRVFRCADFGWRTFCILMGGYMSKNLQKKIIDVIGVELFPGEPTVCLGNGEQGFECCCDECDYYLLCFAEFNPQNKERNIAENKTTIE